MTQYTLFLRALSLALLGVQAVHGAAIQENAALAPAHATVPVVAVSNMPAVLAHYDIVIDKLDRDAARCKRAHTELEGQKKSFQKACEAQRVAITNEQAAMNQQFLARLLQLKTMEANVVDQFAIREKAADASVQAYAAQRALLKETKDQLKTSQEGLQKLHHATAENSTRLQGETTQALVTFDRQEQSVREHTQAETKAHLITIAKALLAHADVHRFRLALVDRIV